MNQQPPENISNAATTTVLEYVDVFETIQGEGPYAGMAATFIRLAGCNLQCPACDTDYTSSRKTASIEEVADLVTSTGLVVITGGEPFRQNIVPLIRKLSERGHLVQIETNGTIPLPLNLPYDTTIVCSPKTPKVAVNVAATCKYWKYVVDPLFVADDGLPRIALGLQHNGVVFRGTGLIYVQPIDKGGSPAEQLALWREVAELSRVNGYIFQLQTHKLIGVK